MYPDVYVVFGAPTNDPAAEVLLVNEVSVLRAHVIGQRLVAAGLKWLPAADREQRTCSVFCSFLSTILFSYI